MAKSFGPGNTSLAFGVVDARLETVTLCISAKRCPAISSASKQKEDKEDYE
jgi:hypothetical protein